MQRQHSKENNVELTPGEVHSTKGPQKRKIHQDSNVGLAFKKNPTELEYVGGHHLISFSYLIIRLSCNNIILFHYLISPQTHF